MDYTFMSGDTGRDDRALRSQTDEHGVRVLKAPLDPRC